MKALRSAVYVLGKIIFNRLGGSAAHNESNKIAFVQILRGISALLVVWAHLSGYWLYLDQSSSPLQDFWRNWVTGPFHLFENGGHLGVLLFFLISGFIISHASRSETRLSFVLKRILRIFPALIFATILTFAIVASIKILGLPLLGLTDAGPLQWLESAFLLDGFIHPQLLLSVTWTLPIEIAFYALVGILLHTQKSLPLQTTLLFSGVWVVLALFSLNASTDWKQLAFSQTIYYLGWLIVGRVAYLAYEKEVGVLDALLISTGLLTLFCAFMEYQSPGYLLEPGGWAGFPPVFTYGLSVLIFLSMLRANPSHVPKAFDFLGNISYSLYLVHLPVGFFVLSVGNAVGMDIVLSTFLAIIISILVSFLSYRWIERPAGKLARYIVGRIGS